MLPPKLRDRGPVSKRDSRSASWLNREQHRICHHLKGAEVIGRSTRHALSPLPALNRALLLDELRRYRLRGKFPHNHAAAHEPVPVFVDEHGTRCAVAHLLDISGQQQLVRKIARTQNCAKIHELAKHPALRAWLAAAGLTVVEAARIQPTYCYYVEAEACFCSEHAAADVSGLAVGTVQSLDQGALQVRIEQIGGFFPGLTAGDIVAVQGRADAQQRVFVGRVRHEDGGVGPFTVVGERLSIVGDSVLCDYNAQTAARPVSLDTAMEAILPQSPCVGTLRVDDSAWNESTCGSEGGFGDDDGGGCSVAHVDSLGGPYIASAALFAALVAYRRLRRSTGRRPTERELCCAPQTQDVSTRAQSTSQDIASLHAELRGFCVPDPFDVDLQASTSPPRGSNDRRSAAWSRA